MTLAGERSLDAAVPQPRVLLIGMMAAGKSTVGHAIAERTGWHYLDNDSLVERAAGEDARHLLEGSGEGVLRARELQALDAVLHTSPPLVASVAAGVVLDEASRQRMKDLAFVVYLRAAMATLARRVGANSDRPWLGSDPEVALRQLFAGRDALYTDVADFVVDVDDARPADLAAAIIAAATSMR